MFTGIIETPGVVESAESRGQGLSIGIRPQAELADLKPGDSLSVDGICLTVEEIRGDQVRVFAVAETLRRTTLGSIGPNSKVNLERALKVGDRLGGHWVTGHIDAVGRIVSDKVVGDSIERWFSLEPNYLAHVVEKGSVSIDGISLTVMLKESWGFCVALIPFTLHSTTQGFKKVGANVNIETDILAKYTESLLQSKGNRLSLATLEQAGF